MELIGRITGRTPKVDTPTRLAMTMKDLYDAGMTTVSGGNLSMRESNGDIWVTPSGPDKSCYIAEDMVKVTYDLQVEGSRQPSMESKIHKSVYFARPDIKAIVHAHSPGTVALSLLNEPPVTEALKRYLAEYGAVEVAPYACPGSNALREKVAKAFRDSNAYTVILENHGVFVASRQGIEDAAERFKALDAAVRIRTTDLSYREIKKFEHNFIGPVTLAMRSRAVSELLESGEPLPMNLIPEALIVFKDTIESDGERILCSGESFLEAYDKAEVAEFVAEAYAQAKRMGGGLHTLTDGEVREIYARYVTKDYQEEEE